MTVCIRYKDQLDEIFNYLQWKVKMLAIFKENKIWNFVIFVVVVPTSYSIALDVHEGKEAKA
jgi:hypothetical protein